MCCKSHQATNLLFKYCLSKLGGGGQHLLIRLEGVQYLGKPADVILERSLIEQTGVVWDSSFHDYVWDLLNAWGCMYIWGVCQRS